MNPVQTKRSREIELPKPREITFTDLDERDQRTIEHEDRFDSVVVYPRQKRACKKCG